MPYMDNPHCRLLISKSYCTKIGIIQQITRDLDLSYWFLNNIQRQKFQMQVSSILGFQPANGCIQQS